MINKKLKPIFDLHIGGKIETVLKKPLRNKADLSKIYTPGVAEVSKYLSANPEARKKYSIAGNTVAIVSDGTAVLGLGDIGPLGALPVMEGKAALFKRFAGLNAFPICLATKDAGEIIKIVRAISPVFAAINLEDISAPRCFEIEEGLQDLGMPVMHDDQHGTAVVTLAGLINACKITNKKMESLRVVISGAGAAGTAISKLLSSRVKDIILVDSRGAICNLRNDLNSSKKKFLVYTNKQNVCGGLEEAIKGADVFVGVSAPGVLTEQMVRTMAVKPMIFAMANPTPEIMPDVAKKAGAAVVATGRSDFDNQVNNALGFPGIFLGAIESGATQITEKMKLAAAEALAGFVKKPTAKKIIPSIFEKGLVQAVSKAVAKAWRN